MAERGAPPSSDSEAATCALDSARAAFSCVIRSSAPRAALISSTPGDSAVLEFVDGAMVLWHDRAYQVMTNEPTFDSHLAVLEHWRGVDPRQFPPGTVDASDRFARAHFHINAVVQSADPRIAAASAFSAIRQTSAPWGISVADAPNLSTTRWRVVADHKDRRYPVKSVLSPASSGSIWADWISRKGPRR